MDLPWVWSPGSARRILKRSHGGMPRRAVSRVSALRARQAQSARRLSWTAWRRRTVEKPRPLVTGGRTRSRRGWTCSAGPSSGTVRLPSHLDWSGNAVYDLDAPGRIVDLYRAVLIEAASPQDLYAYLNDGVLRRLWSLLWLPAQLRKAWEQRFPVLAEISRITAAA
jgi:hypothetical protein